MKLTSGLKQFYLNALGVPVLGKYLFGPTLRGLWKINNRVDQQKQYQTVDNAHTSTYSSAIVSLRESMSIIESRADEQYEFLISALSGLQAAQVILHNRTDDIQRDLSSALSGTNQFNSKNHVALMTEVKVLAGQLTDLQQHLNHDARR